VNLVIREDGRPKLRIFEQPFVLPLLPYLEEAEQAIPPEIRILCQQHDFYLIKYGFDALPQGKERFTKVDIHIDYPDDQGFLTRDLVPDTQIEERFRAEGKVTVALDPHMNVAAHAVVRVVELVEPEAFHRARSRRTPS